MIETNITISNPYRSGEHSILIENPPEATYFRSAAPLFQAASLAGQVAQTQLKPNPTSDLATATINNLATYSNYTATGVSGGLKGALILEDLHLHFASRSFMEKIAYIAQKAALPLSIVMLALGTVQGVAESICLSRVWSIVKQIEARGPSPIEQLHFIQEQYLTLNDRDRKSIYDQVEKRGKALSQEEKALLFDQLAKKKLTSQLGVFKRLFSPKLALFLRETIPQMIRDANSPHSSVRTRTLSAIHLVAESIHDQLNMKLAYHFCSIVGIVLSLISVVLMIVHPIFLLMIVLIFFSGLGSGYAFLLDYFAMQKEGDRIRKVVTPLLKPEAPLATIHPLPNGSSSSLNDSISFSKVG